MKRRQIKVEIPQYLTIAEHKKISTYQGDDNFGRLVHMIVSLTNQPEEEVKQWDGRSLVKLGKMIVEKTNPKQEFHPLIEFKGQLYGYRSLENFQLGEYMDMERLSKDPINNLEQIAALLYRPVEKHSFGSLSFAVKHAIKVVNNSVENVFDWYEVEKYDTRQRKISAILMQDFPVHIILGAMAFFLTIANQYLHDILFSLGHLTREEMMALNNMTMRDLLQTTGGGSGLSTTSLNPTFLQLQETTPSLN